MKKYWQIKPWMFIVLILVLIVTLFYSFGDGSYMAITGGDEEWESGRGMDIAAAPQAAMDADFAYMEYELMEKSYGNDTVGAWDEDGTESTDERMVIKSGSLSIVVDDVRKSVSEIMDYVEGKGGFLVTSNVDKDDLDLYGYVTVRVPAEFFDDAMAFIKEMGEIESEHVEGQDITEEYIDLEAKLGNLQATEAQFLEIMKDAVEIEDILAVQKELSYVRENIESIEGTMKYLKESVDLSSITVYLSTDPSTLPVIDEEDQWKPLAVFKEALRSLLDTGKGVVDALIWFGVYLPVIILILLVIWGIRRHYRKKRKK